MPERSDRVRADSASSYNFDLFNFITHDIVGGMGEFLPVIIPARGGSKGVPGKNIRSVAGKPLLAWSIEDALESQYVSHVFVSTDDAAISDVAREFGAEVIDRPATLARDESSSESALLHALEMIVSRHKEPDKVVFLQATCPIRTGEDIDLALAWFDENEADSLLSASPSHAILWEEHDGKAVPIGHAPAKRMRRQDMAAQFRENGSIYIFKPSVLRTFNSRFGERTVLFKMREEDGLDIDSIADFERAERALNNPRLNH
jgi:CMP-N,N'-diacetyllegionaminic acid synthase